MNTICLDIGTTAGKAAAFADGRRVGEILRVPMPLHLRGSAAELDAETVLQLVLDLIRQAARPLDGRVDRIAPATMSPAICLLDGNDKPITPILCHLDRRSEKQALEIAKHFGEENLLRTIGNLPIPGGIACTMLRWIQTHQPEVYRRAARVAPLTTLITNRLTGGYVCDPGTAVFLGTYSIAPAPGAAFTFGAGTNTASLRGPIAAGQAVAPESHGPGPQPEGSVFRACPERSEGTMAPIDSAIRPWPAMLEFLGLPETAVPAVGDGGAIVGKVTAEVAGQLGLQSQPEVLAGLMDTSAACLHAGLEVGRLYNVIGTTDVLVICTDRPQPAKGVLTRPVGTGPLWLAVSTMAAVGAALDWAHRTFFAERSVAEFFDLVKQIGPKASTAGPAPQAKDLGAEPSGDALRFEPDLAGSRMQVRQRYGAIRGLRLSITREQILAALVASLARRSEKRLARLAKQVKPTGAVFVAGGASVVGVQDLWTGRYHLTAMPEDASLQGLAHLASTARA